MKTLGSKLILTTGCTVLLLGICHIYSQVGSAETANLPRFHASTTLFDNLVAFKNEELTISLHSGQVTTGIVKEVKGNLLHLEKLSQKEFYDALICIDQISAIEARAR